jgi:hypothetical protein
MKKQIMIVVLILMFLTLTSALHGGECDQISLDFDSLDNVVYSVVNNQSNLEGLNITIENNMVSICPEVNYKPDNFTIIFMDNSTHETVVYKSGGSHTKTVYENVTEYVKTYIDKPIIVEKVVEIGSNNSCDVNSNIEVKESNIFQRFWAWLIKIFN